MASEKPAHPLGLHRVPGGVTLPQAAERVDNDTAVAYDREIVLQVERLNIDSASFLQMAETGRDVAAQILDTVRTRGKQHNPVTGSGGMLLGRVARIGSAWQGLPAKVGDRVATLISLTLTPLHLERILSVDAQRHQVEVDGQAILFESSAFARLPSDLPESAALAALDVAGAAPQVARLTHNAAHALGRAPRVLILGCGGKSGLLSSVAARTAGAIVVGSERSEEALVGASEIGACHATLVADAANAVATAEAALAALRALPAIPPDALYDLTVVCVNVAGAEMGTILATSDGGTIYFFSMATSFTKAALGAEGVSRDVTMVIGNGYAPGHADATLNLLREEPALRRLFVERYG